MPATTVDSVEDGAEGEEDLPARPGAQCFNAARNEQSQPFERVGGVGLDRVECAPERSRQRSAQIVLDDLDREGLVSGNPAQVFDPAFVVL